MVHSNSTGVFTMTTSIKSDSTTISPLSSNILSLSLGQLCADERAKLVNAILSNPETAALTKFGLRIANPAQQISSSIVSAASNRRHSNGLWSARNFVTGACASFALLAIFSFSGRSVQNYEPGRVAMNQAQHSDHFGAPGSFETGSFEGAASLNRLESADRFGGGGFEAE